MKGIDKLIINSAYEEPKAHWLYDQDSKCFHQEKGRRPAGYFIAGQGSNRYNDIGEFVELPLVNTIRPRVRAWRENGYPGATGVTKTLLEHWHDPEVRAYQFFFCELDAIETLIWLTEAPYADKVGVNIPGDGGLFKRLCTKLCTGGGKTSVMAMLIAWQVCNKVTYPQDKRFSKNVFVVAPNLTVKNRLAGLQPGGENTEYSAFSVVPVSLQDKLNQGKVLILNWQALEWDSEEQIAKRKSVDKRGAMSDTAYVRSILGDMAKSSNILVINDEAHHAWRKNPEVKVKLSKEQKEAEQEATVWVSALDRIHNVCGILTCYDFSATPFAPSGKKNDEEALFGWIVSDFGLNDGIESGLVKTPHIVIRDDALPDAKTFKSKLYHIYADETVKDDINRSAEETEPLPSLICNAYFLLGYDWLQTYRAWKNVKHPVPPVMITVCNRTETAARIKYSFDHKMVDIPELCDPDYTLRIDSDVLNSLESAKGGKLLEAQALREKVDTIGKQGKSGAEIRNVISVGMLSEGWDARTVTNILGLRAFSSQLLCEQVIGRGLRRVSYDIDPDTGFFTPEYVNIFGIPFSFLPHEESGDVPPPVKPKTQIEVVPEKAEFEISWPNIIRFDNVFKSKLELDISQMPTLTLNRDEIRLSADMAALVDGKTDVQHCTNIDLEKLCNSIRLQKVIFDATATVYNIMKAKWQNEATKFVLFGQIVKITEEYLKSDVITFNTGLFQPEGKQRLIMYMINMNKIVQHLWNYIKVKGSDRVVPIFDPSHRVRSTKGMPTWYTTKPCQLTRKSHISHVVCDSTWEDTVAYKLEHNNNVTAYVKNDHLGFEVIYTYDGVVRKYYPDFLIKLTNGKTLILEVKGRNDDLAKAKHQALDEWVKVVNSTGEFGEWCNAECYNVGEVEGIIKSCI